ncbi:MAG: hypothetical protein AB7T86_04980 [Xanthobacteraceae bacterium]
MDAQAASQKEQTFTAADRTRIRAALLAYAKEHRIGVPTLRERIAKATGRTRNVASGKDPYLVDQKTLQRFLKDSHRTNDAFIVPLALFVEGRPILQATDHLGATLAAFFGPSSGEARKVSDASHLAGSYEVFGPRTLFPDTPGTSEPARWRGRAAPSGTATFAAQGDKLYLSASEYDYFDSAVCDGSTGKRSACEGAVVSFGHVIFALLRNQLSYLPKTYYLRETTDGALAGSVVEGIVRRDQESSYSYAASDDYLFRRIEADAP